MSYKAQSWKGRAGQRDLAKTTMARQSTSHLPLSPLSSASLQASLAPTSSSLLCYNKLTCCLLFNLVHLEKSKHHRRCRSELSSGQGWSLSHTSATTPVGYSKWATNLLCESCMRSSFWGRCQKACAVMTGMTVKVCKEGEYVRQAMMVWQWANRLRHERSCPIDQFTLGGLTTKKRQLYWLSVNLYWCTVNAD